MPTDGDQVTGERITQKAAAAALGVSSPYLSKLRRQGKIAPGPDGLWDLETLKAQIQRSRDINQAMAADTRRRARDDDAAPEAPAFTALDLVDGSAEPSPDADAAADSDDLDENPEYTDDYVENFKIARSFREREDARKARIERMEKERSLTPVADVQRERFTESRMIRDTLMGAFPTKVAPALALISDAFELERHLRNALREALINLVEDVRAIR
ncbi:MAG: hypothetical protein IAE92_16325 [Burkholderiaceae bacterium]|nr:hypothetical protein [Burkholderiaceae bacterium]